jgi:hypothetical protein
MHLSLSSAELTNTAFYRKQSLHQAKVYCSSELRYLIIYDFCTWYARRGISKAGAARSKNWWTPSFVVLGAPWWVGSWRTWACHVCFFTCNKVPCLARKQISQVSLPPAQYSHTAHSIPGCAVYHYTKIRKWIDYVRFEVFTAVTMKNGVFLDVTPCSSCKNRRFGGT